MHYYILFETYIKYWWFVILNALCQLRNVCEIYYIYYNRVGEVSLSAFALNVSLTSCVVAPGIGKPAGHPNSPQHSC